MHGGFTKANTKEAMETTVSLTGDDMDDLLSAIGIYEQVLLLGDEDSVFVHEVLENLANLQKKILLARKNGMH